MILLFYSLGFLLAHEHVQTLGTFLHGNSNRLVSVLFASRGSLHTTPLSATDFDQLVEKYLIILVDGDVLLVILELTCLLPLVSIFLHLLGDLASLSLSPVSYTHLTLPTICSV